LDLGPNIAGGPGLKTFEFPFVGLGPITIIPFLNGHQYKVASIYQVSRGEQQGRTLLAQYPKCLIIFEIKWQNGQLLAQDYAVYIRQLIAFNKGIKAADIHLIDPRCGLVTAKTWTG